MDAQNLKTNTIKGLKWFFYSFIWLFILMFAIDVISKQLVIANREALVTNASGQGFVLIPNFLAINFVVNHNVAFGIKIGNNEVATRAIYIVIALIASGAIVAYSILKRKTNGKYVKACLMLILAGALGNCVDRIFFTGEMLSTTARPNETNGVVDWINFFGIWKFNFNWADSCLVVGVIMLLVYLIVMEVLEYTRNKKKEPKVVTEKGVTQKVLSKEEQERLENDNKIKQENESKNTENGE